MPGTEWVFKLKDQMSGPASGIDRQLRLVTASLRQLDLQTKMVRLEKMTDPLKKQRLELQIHRDKLLMSKRALEDHGRASTSTARSWTDSVVKFAGSLYILDTVRRALGAVGRAASDMGSQIREAVESKQGALFGLRSQMGDRAGGRFVEQLERQAQLYGRPPSEIVGQGRELLQAGAEPESARAWVAAIQDIRASRGAAAAAQFQGAVQQMIQSPVFSMGNLQAFGNVFGMKPLFRHFAKEMRVGAGDVEPLLQMNQLRSDAAQGMMQRFQAQLAGQRGMLGGLAQRFGASTLEGSFGRVQSAWERLLASLESSQGVKTLQQVLQNLAETLGDRKLRKSVTNLADTLGEALKPLTGADGKKNMQDFFSSMSKSIEDVMPGLKSLVEFTGKLAGRGVQGLSGMGLGWQFLKDMFGVATGNPPEKSSVATNVLMSALTGGGGIPGTGPAQRPDWFGYLGAAGERALQAPPRPPLTLQITGPLVALNSSGSSIEDAHKVAHIVREQLQDVVEEWTTQEQGGVP